MEAIEVKVSVLGPMRQTTGIEELDTKLPENSTLEDLMAVLSNKLGCSFEEGLKPTKGGGTQIYILMVNGVTISLDAMGSYRLKHRDTVTLAPLLIGGG